MKIKNTFVAILVVLAFNTSYGQSNKFKLDTLVGDYFVKIVVFQKTLDAQNMKASFSFYDTTSARTLKFAYSFKYLPSKENKGGSYVPIFKDYENDEYSNYIWQDIDYDSFDYEKVKTYVFDQVKTKTKLVLEDFSSNELELKEKAKNEYLHSFNALINKDYLTFVKSIHPAQLNDSSYASKAAYYKSINQSSNFKFTSVSVEKIDTLINFNGEIQVLFYSKCGYISANTTGELRKIMIARSFDKGKNWYFSEIEKHQIASEITKSKGNLVAPAISPEILGLIK